MLNILADISADPELSINLGFKGGTCCYFFYDLDRFSIDLYFDLLNLAALDGCLEKLDLILKKYGVLKKDKELLVRKIKYSEESSALKIDISERMDINKLNTYEIKDVVSGIPLNVLRKEDIFAHKLVAAYDRFSNKKVYKIIANRDLYDINFFFSHNWHFNKEIIKLRLNKNAKDYFRDLIKIIEKNVDDKKILNGIGALLDERRREWAKNNLKKEVIKQLAISVKSME